MAVAVSALLPADWRGQVWHLRPVHQDEAAPAHQVTHTEGGALLEQLQGNM